MEERAQAAEEGHADESEDEDSPDGSTSPDHEHPGLCARSRPPEHGEGEGAQTQLQDMMALVQKTCSSR